MPSGEPKLCPPIEAPCPRPKTIFARGPQQKIVIERECPPPERKERAGAPTEPSPERVAAAVTAQQDVLLIPRMVYVPYVAQTPTRAARIVAPVAREEEDRVGAPLPPPEKKERIGAPAPEKKEPLGAPMPCPPETCPDDCGPSTIIEIRQMNQRIERLHQMLDRLLPGHR